jgi:hypothetical protein
MKSRTVVRTVVAFASFILPACVNSSEDTVTFPEGLVAYYPLNGNADDKSGNGHNGVLVGAVAAADRFGKQNAALSFNGTSSYIHCGDILDEVFSAPVAKFSVAGWAYTRTMGSYSRGGGLMIGKTGGGTLGPYQWDVTHLDGVVSAAVSSDPTSQNYMSVTSPMPPNQWFYFVFVFDGSLPEADKIQLYVNGESVNSGIYRHFGTLGSSTTNTAQELTIGSGHVGGNPKSPNNCYDGILDEVRIYNRALSFQEQHDLYVSKN